ncbi:hypothetical protein CBOM_04306 [Ceraceosorus bombacis]|uniref:CFEM domain-containing protein n=1 Tax=Ceraceosorus bombacis TaxID=401625 RepID=A0A0P1BPN1_9BASI|nr:hypothetical protein CBOM_04306 [Ceraceosorus bombacis]
MRFALRPNLFLLATFAALLVVSSVYADHHSEASAASDSATNGTASAGGATNPSASGSASGTASGSATGGQAAELQACFQQCAIKSATDVKCQGLGEPACFCKKQEFVDETAKCSMACPNTNAQALTGGLEQLKQLCVSATGNFTLSVPAGMASGSAAANGTSSGSSTGSSSSTAGHSDAAAFIVAPAATALAGVFVFTVAVAATL